MYWFGFAMSTEVIKLCGKSTVILGIKRSMHHETNSIISFILSKSQYNLQSIHYKEQLKRISETRTSKLVVMWKIDSEVIKACRWEYIFQDRLKMPKILSWKDIPDTIRFSYLQIMVKKYRWLQKCHWWVVTKRFYKNRMNLSSPDDNFPIKLISYV